MIGATLKGEYRAALQLLHGRFDLLQRLMGYSIPIEAIAAATPAPERIFWDRGARLYQPDEIGKWAWVLPIRAVDPFDPEWIETADPIDVVSRGEIVDLLAFNPDFPGHWALRCGLATVLGAIEPQYCDPDPVPVHRDVADWLRTECNGIVLLTQDPYEAARILRQADRVVVEDDRHADVLRRLIATPPPSRTRVVVRPKSMRVAA